MRYAKIKGKDIYLTEKEYEKLLKRFDPKRFKKVENTYYDYMEYKNNARCIFCDNALLLTNYSTKLCEVCPFGVLEFRNIIGCFTAIHSVLTRYEKQVLYRKFDFDDDNISFTGREETGKKILRKIHSAIEEGFKKVKKGNKK
jgi:hypothetical protein